jgi:hypothetical protein
MPTIQSHFTTVAWFQFLNPPAFILFKQGFKFITVNAGLGVLRHIGPEYFELDSVSNACKCKSHVCSCSSLVNHEPQEHVICRRRRRRRAIRCSKNCYHMITQYDHPPCCFHTQLPSVPMRSSIRLLLPLLFCILLSPSSHGLTFNLEAGTEDCFYEDVPIGSEISGSFQVCFIDAGSSYICLLTASVLGFSRRLPRHRRQGQHPCHQYRAIVSFAVTRFLPSITCSSHYSRFLAPTTASTSPPPARQRTNFYSRPRMRAFTSAAPYAMWLSRFIVMKFAGFASATLCLR